MEIDDDILIIQDINRPNQPEEDPLEISPYKKEINYSDDNKVNSKNEIENIINLDSSDDENPTINHNNQNYGSVLYKKPPTAIRNTAKETSNKFNACSVDKNKIIFISRSHLKLDQSLDSDMYNQLPTTMQIAERLLEPSDHGSRADVPRKQNLTYLGKIMRCPGQPSLIENSSGLMFRADIVPSSTHIEKANNLENEMDLYRSFFNTSHQGHNMQSPNQNKLIKDLFTENASRTNTLATKIPDSTVNKRFPTFKQSFNTKSINSSDTLLRIQQSADNIAGKRKRIQCQGQSIRKRINNQYAPIVIPFQPQEPNGTVLDLNLNINNSESATNPTNTISPSQSAMMLSNGSTGIYNLALDLVVNVNDRNQAHIPHQISPQNQFTNLNNVALDVSFNVNHKGKPGTVTSTQIGHSISPQYYQEPILNNRDDQKEVASTMTVNSYCCGICLFKTTDPHLIQTHLCTAFPSTHLKKSIGGIYKKRGNLHCCNLCMFKTVHFSVMKAHESLHYIEKDQCLRSNSTEKIYCCVACSFQTLDLKVMGLHVCTSSNKALLDKVDTPFSNKDFERVETPAQKYSKETDLHQNEVQKSTIEESLEASLEKIYCCIACAFQTSNFKVIRAHVCPLNNISTITVNKGLEHLETTVQKSLVELNNHQNKEIQTVYNCASCILQTSDLNIIKGHNCSLLKGKKKYSSSKRVTRKATGEPVSQSQQPEFYCCMSCSFKTKSLSLVQSHKCRESNTKTIKAPSNKVPPVVISDKQRSTVPGLEKTPNLQATLNNLDEVLESSVVKKKVFMCEICRQNFSRKYLLFHHLRHIHFGVRTTTIFGCPLCTCYVDNVEAIIHHLQGTHRTPAQNEKVVCKEVYMCTACNIQTDTFQSITMHFDAHIKSYESIIKISYQQDPSKIRLHKSSTTDNPYECILCGEESDTITLWLTHKCKDDETESKVSQSRKREGPETIRALHTVTGKRREQSKAIAAPKDLCHHCKTEVAGAALKCDSSECDAVYHLKCVEVYCRFMHPCAINRRYNWFCVECTDDTVPFQDDVDNIAWCIELTDKEYMLEVEKQKLMVNELKKIKSEKVKIKEDFERIKKFVLECKSKKINNVIVKSVCTIVESFINAGIDNSTD